jgi:ABC-type transport system involved in cytochrome bd biosynthesis fused ATPase/permease subunit
MLLQNTISEECKGLTVLTIAHRISTVLNMDCILVLDHGTLVSIDIDVTQNEKEGLKYFHQIIIFATDYP